MEHSFHRVRSLQACRSSRRDQEAREHFRRRTMSFPGFLPSGKVAVKLSEEAEKQAAKMLQNWKNEWIQLAGHKDTFTPAGPHTLWKKQESQNCESLAYQALLGDRARCCVPHFYRQLFHNGHYYIEIDDLLNGFCNPNVMDIKMGTRTFLETEVQNPTLRKDLYDKLRKLAPDAATAEEREQMAITKLRYMKLREEMSSTSTLGFRIDALRMADQPPDCCLKTVRTASDVQCCLRKFVQGSACAAHKLLQRLIEIRRNLESSSFFKSHEVIGSSLLLIHDSRGNANCWMIDFGKTKPVDRRIDHRASWTLGNHEDGYLTGLDNLIKIFTELVHEQEPSHQLATNFSDLNCNPRISKSENASLSSCPTSSQSVRNS